MKFTPTEDGIALEFTNPDGDEILVGITPQEYADLIASAPKVAPLWEQVGERGDCYERPQIAGVRFEGVLGCFWWTAISGGSCGREGTMQAARDAADAALRAAGWVPP